MLHRKDKTELNFQTLKQNKTGSQWRNNKQEDRKTGTQSIKTAVKNTKLWAPLGSCSGFLWNVTHRFL